MTTITQPLTSAPTPPIQQEIGLAGFGATAQPPANSVATTRRQRSNKPYVHACLIIVCCFALVPFLWMVSTSLKTLPNAMAFPPQWIPWPMEFRNYWDVLTSGSADFLRWTRNTLIIAALGVTGTTLSSALVAYAFAKIKFAGRGFLFGLMLATMMVPFPVTMVSLFTLFRWLGETTHIQMLGTFKPLWLPLWFGSAFNIFLLRQFFITIPDDLSEAARIDGCSEFGIFWRVILPLARPALTVVALFAFMGIWNDFLGPLIYMQRSEQFTLALGLQNFQSQHGGTPWHQLMAASTMVILPVLLLFFLAQKTFIEGIATTGMKG